MIFRLLVAENKGILEQIDGVVETDVHIYFFEMK